MDLLQFLVDKNNIFIVAVALVSGIMLAVPALRKGRGGSGISSAEAIQMVNQRHAVWVDVRPAEAFKAGHIPQARNMPADELEQKAGSLPKNKPLVVVCETGREAGRVASRLRSQGFAEVAVMDGGMRGWASAGLPVTQKS